MIQNNSVRLVLIVVPLLVGLCLILGGHWFYGMGLHLLVMGPLLWGTLLPNSRLFGPIQTHTASSELWLTLDDGPDPQDTPKILDLLQAHGVKATFFVIGKKAKQYPELIKRIVRDGHSLGNHTWSHPQASFWSKGPWATYREIKNCQDVLESITGHAPRLFRAPVGHHQVFVHAVLKSLGLRLVGWSARGYDAVSSDEEKVIRSIRASMKPGVIILAHEATPIALDVVESILQIVKEKGWSFSIPDESQR